MNAVSPLTTQHYTCLYAWLAGLFAHELDEAQLARLRSTDTQAWLDLLCQQTPLRPALQHLQAALAALEVRPDARLELAADFAGLFLLSQKRAALPYASCYQGETPRFHQAICVEMQSLLRQAGMQLNANFHEPEDHLSIFLELLSLLSFASAEQPEHQESKRMQLRRSTLSLLLGWLPAFSRMPTSAPSNAHHRPPHQGSLPDNHKHRRKSISGGIIRPFFFCAGEAQSSRQWLSGQIRARWV
ncbi:molecular chaperone TorD [Edwardsiella anguillarum]|uniref:Molecular chaperone TorD n=1 Tax=Edwardsiella anguillarum TaxID=1821960 RepID=A0ABY8SF75_9GAMM|nr:molecular chaperone TorD [Edwardsiella anguillarum]WHP84160.1 molecular chaperone TorD [Edwardsiella anguillarum]WHP91750.1 molecular chaperone TorD [Edwardsiella anguillarum]WHP95552.1 molecular chaperone TorD [Edwardsiella anguillarum]WHP99414.1 molecular chaperone TorD [Edwardsiella anguillarum]WHQ03167.1 molecular chaperone TorD [Edwardsiella anguillarum]